MIRYDITEAELRTRIDHEKANWRTRAQAATALYKQAGKYGEPDDKSWDTQTHGVSPRPFWGEIKRVYMRLQKNKCAFCEQKMAGRARDHDVEHFRPKRGVKAWPPPGGPTYDFPTGQAFPEGYPLLAYHPLNYATSCTHCNQGLKRSYFPIESARLSGEDHPRSLRPELPLLIYPIGHSDTDPEVLLGFRGISPRPKNTDQNSRENHRARVVIAFFDLSDREELLRERSEVIEHLHHSLVLADDASDLPRQRRARSIVNRMRSDGSKHANCARCFIALHHEDPDQAERFANLATDFLDTL